MCWREGAQYTSLLYFCFPFLSPGAMMASVDTSAFTGLLTAVAKELNDHGVYGIGDVVFSAEMFARGAQKRRRETRSNACSQPSVPGNTDSNSDSSEQLFMPKRIRHSNSLSKGRTSAFHAFTSSGPAERGAADVWGTVRSPHSGLCREASPSPRFSGNDSPELHRLLDRAESRDSDVSHGEQHTVKQELQAWTLPTASRRDDIQSRLTSASGLQEKPCGTSGFRGVSWHTQTQRWKAQIKVGGKDINLGRHRDEEAAARAYDRAAICARGLAGAKLNFPAECYEAEAEALSVTPLETLAATLRGVEARLQAQTSRFHGVRLNKRTAKWEAYIRVAGKHVHLGCYDSEVAAAQAFDQAAIVRHTRHPGPANQKPAFLLNYSCSCYQSFLAALGVPESSLPEAKPPLAVNNRTGSRTITVVAPLEEKYIANLVTKCRGDGSDSTR